jgi:mevalonate kinase
VNGAMNGSANGGAVIQASAPGKLILAGEHAAVFGHPALVASLGLRVRAELESWEEREGLLLELPDLGVETDFSWREIDSLTRRTRSEWDSFIRRGRALPPAATDPLDQATRVVQIALGEARADQDASRSSGGIRLRITSALPMGAGCGSSAAVAAAVVSAYLAHRGFAGRGRPFIEALERIVGASEQRQHGTPSGIDAACVLRGGVLWIERSEDRLNLRAQADRSDLLSRLTLFDTGTPSESTGEVVAQVRERSRAEPEKVAHALGRLAQGTRFFRRQLEKFDPEITLRVIRDLQGGLEELGVVPEPVRELVARVVERGGAAKISGAGSLGGPGAGMLLVYHPEPEAILPMMRKARARQLSAALGTEGLRVETVGATTSAPRA